VNSTKHLIKNSYQSFSASSKIYEEGTHPNSLCEVSVTLTPKPEGKKKKFLNKDKRSENYLYRQEKGRPFRTSF